MKYSAFLLMSVFTLFGSRVVAQTTDAPVLIHDPFAEPVLRKLTESKNDTKNSQPDASEPWVPNLTSTLRAGKNSMAIVNGRVIKLGEEIEGYDLIEVHERSVVLVKDGQKTQLTLDK
jgi:hypothetical protein